MQNNPAWFVRIVHIDKCARHLNDYFPDPVLGDVTMTHLTLPSQVVERTVCTVLHLDVQGKLFLLLVIE